MAENIDEDVNSGRREGNSSDLQEIQTPTPEISTTRLQVVVNVPPLLRGYRYELTRRRGRLYKVLKAIEYKGDT